VSDENIPRVAERADVDGINLPGAETDVGQRPERISFIIPGAPKAGTTAMSWFLAQHPDIYMPAVKELNFFIRSGRYKRGVAGGYRDYHDVFENYRDGQLAGESSPNYLPTRVFAPRAFKYNPQMRLICMVRNPIERAYSNYIMEFKRGDEPWPFGKAIRRERWRKLLQRHRRKLRSPAYAYVQRGFYARQIRHLLKHFPREQVLVVLNEDLQEHHERVLREVYDFLGVRQVDPPGRAKVFKADYDPMSDSDRRYLQTVYRRDIDDLSELTGRDLSHWV